MVSSPLSPTSLSKWQMHRHRNNTHTYAHTATTCDRESLDESPPRLASHRQIKRHPLASASAAPPSPCALTVHSIGFARKRHHSAAHHPARPPLTLSLPRWGAWDDHASSEHRPPQRPTSFAHQNIRITTGLEQSPRHLQRPAAHATSDVTSLDARIANPLASTYHMTTHSNALCGRQSEDVCRGHASADAPGTPTLTPSPPVRTPSRPPTSRPPTSLQMLGPVPRHAPRRRAWISFAWAPIRSAA